MKVRGRGLTTDIFIVSHLIVFYFIVLGAPIRDISLAIPHSGSCCAFLFLSFDDVRIVVVCPLFSEHPHGDVMGQEFLEHYFQMVPWEGRTRKQSWNRGLCTESLAKRGMRHVQRWWLNHHADAQKQER